MAEFTDSQEPSQSQEKRGFRIPFFNRKKEFGDDQKELDALESETPGFRKQYSRNFRLIGLRRQEQGVGSETGGPDMKHLHHEAIDTTKKDFDPLTGTLKREVALEILDEISKEALSTNESVFVAFIDLNYLKNINTTKGHKGGDYAMRLVGKALTQSLREEDVVGRYGGDELIAVLRNVTREQARQIIQERLFTNVIEGLTISVGLSKLVPGNSQQTIEDADSAMYQAKDEAHTTNQNQMRFFDELGEVKNVA